MVRLTLCLTSVSLAACVGSVDEADLRSPGQVPSAMPSPTDLPPSSCGGQPLRAAAGLPLAPLRVKQYVNTLFDLLQIDVTPLIEFGDAGGRGFKPGVFTTSIEVEQRLATAESIAALAASAKHLPRILQRLGCDPAKAGASTCADRFIDGIGRRAFRRPLEPDERTDLRQLFDAGMATGDFSTGVETMLAGVLQAPQFLYQVPVPARAGGDLGKVVRVDDYALASRLSYFLWNSTPDDELLAVAAGARLGDDREVEAQVRRMIALGRTRPSREDFFDAWLGLGALPLVPHSEPEFTASLAADLRKSLLASVHQAYGGDGRIESLLGGSTVFLNDQLGALYLPQRPMNAGVALKPVTFPGAERTGLVTHPAMMALLARTDGGDPIRRGKFIRMGILCETLPRPPNNVPPLPDLRPGLSKKERLSRHAADPTCKSCHQLMDNIGFAFEGYDALGRYRATEGGKPIDTAGEVMGGGDLAGTFAKGTDLFRRIVDSKTVRACFATQWYGYALARDLGSADECALGALKERFSARGDLNDLYVGIALGDTFLNQRLAE